jgi:rhodanese-related sulfurtransferase
MRYVGIICFNFFSLLLFAQNPEGFDNMANRMAGRNTPVITKSEVEKKLNKGEKIIFLDTREKSEYTVSHMPGSVWVGYDDIDWKTIDKLDKKVQIIVYCSVGYRSGKLTDKMKEKGFTNVKNLYGGLFNWANNDGRVVNMNEKATNEVHGYNTKWSGYLNDKKVKLIL